MIKNVRWGVVLGLLVAAGCGNAAAKPRPALQGVIELDMRTLAFEVPGRVAEVAVKEGDQLRGEVVVARLDDSLALPEREARAAELAAAQAQLALLEAGARSEEVRAVEVELRAIDVQLAVLKRQRTRQDTLTEQGASASARLDELDAQQSVLSGRRDVAAQRLKALRGGARDQELDAARARVRALAAGLAAVDARLARYGLSFSGAADVVEVHVKNEEVVAAGAPAVTIADLDHPYVDVFVPQAEVRGYRVGAPMSVRTDGLPSPVRGRIERVGYKAEFTPRFLFSEKERANLVIRVRVRIEDRGHMLTAGVPAFATLSGEER